MRGVAAGTLRAWTAAEDELLAEHYRKGDVKLLAELLGRSPDAVRTHYRWLVKQQRSREAEIAQNDESRPATNGRRWTREEQEFLEATMDEPVAQVAACLNRSIFATQQRRHRTLIGETFTYEDHYREQPETHRRGAPVTPTALPTCARCTTQHNGDC